MAIPRRDRSPITQPGYGKGRRPGNAGKTYSPEPLSHEEALRLIDQCPRGVIGVRNRALLVVMWRSGLRVSEALSLRPHHVDYSDQTVTVLRGKGGKRRVVGIDLWALEEIQDWYAVRARFKTELPVDAPLFCTMAEGSRGNALNSSYVRTVIKRNGQRAGIHKRVHPHGFRHSFAVDLVREHMSMNVVQRSLGHSNLGVTATYLSGIANFEIVEAVASRPAPKRDEVAA